MKLGIFIICFMFFISGFAAQTKRQSVIEDQTLSLLNLLSGKTIGMLTNPTSTDSKMEPLFQRIIQNKVKYNITIKCFFAPQHGLRGDRQDGAGDGDYIDEDTGIQVYSLYGTRKAPTSAQLQGLNILLYDIQDVGCRFYTFIWTLTYTIEVLSTTGVELAIFDRPNPLGRKVEGCPLNFDVGLIGRLLPGQFQTIPQRYGLTIGQFIKFLRPYLPSFKLNIVTMKQVYEIHDNEWVMSSPNMPTLQTVRVYPGMGLIEDTSISEGRGTTKPFEITGNPKLHPMNVIKYFTKNNITSDSYYLRQNYFIPTFNKHLNQVCGGVQIHIRDYEKYDSVETAMHILKAYLQNAKELNITVSASGLDRMFGRIGFSSQIQNPNYSVADILNSCKSELNAYKTQSQRSWIYNITGSRMEQISSIHILEPIEKNDQKVHLTIQTE